MESFNGVLRRSLLIESKQFCLGEHFISYDDLKEKIKKYEEENVWNV